MPRRPIKMVSRGYLITDHLYPTLQTRSCIFSAPLRCLDVTPVPQVRGGHSVQWPVSAGEPPRERGLQADGRGGHEHICQLEQGWLEVRKIQKNKLTVTMQWSNDFDCISGCFWGEQGAEDFGHRDGDVHRHVLPLPADQDHEECPLAGRQVRTENTAFQKSSHNIH